jgi:predicted transcriptional regulator
VKTALLELGMTVTDLADVLDLSRNAVSRAINQTDDLPTVKEAIRKKLAELQEEVPA